MCVCVLGSRISAGRSGDGDVGSSRRRGDEETNGEVSSYSGSSGQKKRFSTLSIVIPIIAKMRVGSFARLPSASSSRYPCEHKERVLEGMVKIMVMRIFVVLLVFLSKKKRNFLSSNVSDRVRRFRFD